MLLASEERFQIARLFNFLLQGEQLAFDCATKQADLFQDPLSKRFLRAQAHQEALHVKILKAGIGILVPRGVGEPIAKSAMADYRRLLEAALDRGDASESLLGMQIILEGLGDITLNRISAGFSTRGLTFRRVRQLIVGQEDAHHSFGLRRFQHMMSTQPNKLNRMRHQSELYLEVVDNLLQTLTPLFEYFEEDPREYLDELQLMIPHNLVRAVA